MIIYSMKSFMWGMCLLTIIIYVFAICFTSSATITIKAAQTTSERSRVFPEVHRQFGTMARTIYTLVMAMLGGTNWGIISDAALEINWFATALFFFYVFFTMLAVLNIITGVFVDNAVEMARTQRDFMI